MMSRCKHQLMRTTLTLDDDVAERVHERCRKTRRSFKEVVNELLRLGLLEQAKSSRRKPFRVHTRPLRARPGLNLDNIGELLEQIDGAAHK